jgi:hypothetical protein
VDTLMEAIGRMTDVILILNIVLLTGLSFVWTKKSWPNTILKIVLFLMAMANFAVFLGKA